jgi:hypothetical protein
MQNLTKASTSLNSAHQEQLNATSYGASLLHQFNHLEYFTEYLKSAK